MKQSKSSSSIPRHITVLAYGYLLVLVVTVLVTIGCIATALLFLFSGNIDAFAKNLMSGVTVLVGGYVTCVVLGFFVTGKWQLRPIVIFQRKRPVKPNKP